MKKIAVVTATRAEYGLLFPVIRELRRYESVDLKVELLVTGTHLSEKYGLTVTEIEESGVRIDHRIRIPVKSDSELNISNNQAEALVKFTKQFSEQHYNAIVLLGDRYETLAIAIAAGNTRTPVFHLCGGDTTEGALDEWIRHSITKISYLHFTTNDESRRRVIQLGEDPDRVYNYGSTSIDNIISIADMTKAEALNSIGLNDCQYVVCTYHPATMKAGSVDAQINAFIAALIQFPEIQFIITKSNADQGGGRINQLLDEWTEKTSNIYVFSSLGMRRYLSLMKHAELVLGNSSSGIIETPSFNIPTVNIGDRQRGRLRAESVIDCEESTESIVKAIRKAMSSEFKAVCQEVKSPYGDGHSGTRIAKKCIEVISEGSIDLRKKFYDLVEK